MLDTGYGFIGEDGVERVSPEEVWEAEAEVGHALALLHGASVPGGAALFRRGLTPSFCCPGRSKRDKLRPVSLDCLPVEFTAFMW